MFSPNSVLSLHTEEEGRGKVLICQNARSEGGVVDVLQDIVTVDVADQPPDHREDKPGDQKTGDKGKEGVAPLHVNHGGEHILEIDNFYHFL